MKGFKIWVADLTNDECILYGYALFSLGYTWASGDATPLYVYEKPHTLTWLRYDQDITVTGFTNGDKENFDACEQQEIKLTDIFRGV